MWFRYLASDGESQVGVVDLDICGPSLATMFHAEDQSVHESNDSWCPVVVDENLYLMSVWFLLSSPDDAVVWRGPRKNGLIKQFLSKVHRLKTGVKLLPPSTLNTKVATSFLSSLERTFSLVKKQMQVFSFHNIVNVKNMLVPLVLRFLTQDYADLWSVFENNFFTSYIKFHPI